MILKVSNSARLAIPVLFVAFTCSLSFRSGLEFDETAVVKCSVRNSGCLFCCCAVQGATCCPLRYCPSQCSGSAAGIRPDQTGTRRSTHSALSTSLTAIFIFFVCFTAASRAYLWMICLIGPDEILRSKRDCLMPYPTDSRKELLLPIALLHYFFRSLLLP